MSWFISYMVSQPQHNTHQKTPEIGRVSNLNYKVLTLAGLKYHNAATTTIMEQKLLQNWKLKKTKNMIMLSEWREQLSTVHVLYESTTWKSFEDVIYQGNDGKRSMHLHFWPPKCLRVADVYLASQTVELEIGIKEIFALYALLFIILKFRYGNGHGCFSLGLLNGGENIHVRCQQEYDQLKEEFENYKISSKQQTK